jgi:hypothetical protein
MRRDGWFSMLDWPELLKALDVRAAGMDILCMRD